MEYYICPDRDQCREVLCIHRSKHLKDRLCVEHHLHGCKSRCVLVKKTDFTWLIIISLIALYFLILLLAGKIPTKNIYPSMNPVNIGMIASSPDDSQAMRIISILDGEAQPNDLKSYWPSAAIAMLQIGRLYNIPPEVLAVIARAEGGLRSPEAVRKKNIFGLSHNDALVSFKKYDDACNMAAKIVSNTNGSDHPDSAGYKYSDSPVEYDYWDNLAMVYCPKNSKLWADNCRSIWRECHDHR